MAEIIPNEPEQVMLLRELKNQLKLSDFTSFYSFLTK